MRRLVWFAFPLVLALHQTLACGLPSEECGQNRPCTEGFRCIEGRCLPSCQTWRDCIQGERCGGGGCSKTPCISAACEEGQQRCTSTLDRGLRLERCQRQEDGCFSWADLGDCDQKVPCKEEPCTACEECQEEALRCKPDGTALQQCIVLKEGCTGWGREISCGAKTCQDGRCVSPCRYQGQEVKLCPAERPVCYEGNCCKDYRCNEDPQGCSPTNPLARRTCQRENAECYEWKEILCEAGHTCASCKEGETRCSAKNPTAREVCQKDAAGCLFWQEIACEAGNRCSACVQGNRYCSSSKNAMILCQRDQQGCLFQKEILCGSEVRCELCNEGESRCSTQKAGITEICYKSENGCVGWKEVACVGGKACETCDVGKARCSSVQPEGTEVCERDAVGCTGWVPSALCKEGKLCVENGLCALHKCPIEGQEKCMTTNFAPHGIPLEARARCTRDPQGRLFWELSFCEFPEERCLERGFPWVESTLCADSFTRLQENCAFCENLKTSYICNIVGSPDLITYCKDEEMCFDAWCRDVTDYDCSQIPPNQWVCHQTAKAARSLFRCERSPDGRWIKRVEFCYCTSASGGQDATCPLFCTDGQRRCVGGVEEICQKDIWSKHRACRADEECRNFEKEPSKRCVSVPVLPAEQASVASFEICTQGGYRRSPVFSTCHVKDAYFKPTPP